ncbi:MAG: hypothetical protein U9N11_07990 [Campylobacterota bacterium]|nr:hypothetical protein [Campylobacterota bacterium]
MIKKAKRLSLFVALSSTLFFTGCVPVDSAYPNTYRNQVGPTIGVNLSTYGYPYYYDRPYYFFNGLYYYGGNYRDGLYYYGDRVFRYGHYYNRGHRYYNGRRYQAYNGRHGYYSNQKNYKRSSDYRRMVRDKNRRLNNGKHYRQSNTNTHNSQRKVRHSKINTTNYRQIDMRQATRQRSLSGGQSAYMEQVRMRSSTPTHVARAQRRRL